MVNHRACSTDKNRSYRNSNFLSSPQIEMNLKHAYMRASKIKLYLHCFIIFVRLRNYQIITSDSQHCHISMKTSEYEWKFFMSSLHFSRTNGSTVEQYDEFTYVSLCKQLSRIENEIMYLTTSVFNWYLNGYVFSSTTNTSTVTGPPMSTALLDPPLNRPPNQPILLPRNRNQPRSPSPHRSQAVSYATYLVWKLCWNM